MDRWQPRESLRGDGRTERSDTDGENEPAEKERRFDLDEPVETDKFRNKPVEQARARERERDADESAERPDDDPLPGRDRNYRRFPDADRFQRRELLSF